MVAVWFRFEGGSHVSLTGNPQWKQRFIQSLSSLIKSDVDAVA